MDDDGCGYGGVWNIYHMIYFTMWFCQFINGIAFRWYSVLWCIIYLLMWIDIWRKLIMHRVLPYPIKWYCGCQYGTFKIKALLHLIHNNNLPTWLASANLVKAFDTYNHALLITILEKYGVPPRPQMGITRSPLPQYFGNLPLPSFQGNFYGDFAHIYRQNFG